MAKTKKDLVDKLVNSGLIDESQITRFEALQVADLETVSSLLDKNEELSTNFGEANDTIEGLEKQVSDLKLVNEKLNKGKSIEVKEVEQEPGLEFEFRKDKYKFNDDAPKLILFGGVARTQEELSKDEDALVWLISEDSSLIKKI